ncbi:MAG: tetratricopeptide repeat protein, partial [Candidatus Omnitrophota bacterium]
MIISKKIICISCLWFLLSGFVDVQAASSNALIGKLADIANDARPPSQKDLSRAIAHYTLGLLYDSENQVKEAIKEYQKALEYDYSQPSIHIRIGADCLFLGDTKKAVKYFKLAKRFDPQDKKTRELLALVYTSARDFKRARQEYEELLELYPDDIMVRGSLADLYAAEKDFDKAAAIYESLIAKDVSPRVNAKLHFNLAMVYIKMGKMEKAAQEL